MPRSHVDRANVQKFRAHEIGVDGAHLERAKRAFASSRPPAHARQHAKRPLRRSMSTRRQRARRLVPLPSTDRFQRLHRSHPNLSRRLSILERARGVVKLPRHLARPLHRSHRRREQRSRRRATLPLRHPPRDRPSPSPSPTRRRLPAAGRPPHRSIGRSVAGPRSRVDRVRPITTHHGEGGTHTRTCPRPDRSRRVRARSMDGMRVTPRRVHARRASTDTRTRART